MKFERCEAYIQYVHLSALPGASEQHGRYRAGAECRFKGKEFAVRKRPLKTAPTQFPRLRIGLLDRKQGVAALQLPRHGIGVIELAASANDSFTRDARLTGAVDASENHNSGGHYDRRRAGVFLSLALRTSRSSAAMVRSETPGAC